MTGVDAESLQPPVGGPKTFIGITKKFAFMGWFGAPATPLRTHRPFLRRGRMKVRGGVPSHQAACPQRDLAGEGKEGRKVANSRRSSRVVSLHGGAGKG